MLLISIFEQAAVYTADTLSVLGGYLDVIEHFKPLASFYLLKKFLWKSTTEKYLWFSCNCISAVVLLSAKSGKMAMDRMAGSMTQNST